ncbi:MAG: Sec-independent protein translocase protein TatB [Ferrimonas sp.]
MFDGFGFFELILVAIIGLVVLGPERLPVAVRTISRWISTIKRMASSVRTELEQELKIEQLQADLKKAEAKGLQDLDPELQKSIDELREAAASVNRPYASDSRQSTSESAPVASTPSVAPNSSAKK